MSETFVTLVNRTDTPLEGVWDGRVHLLPPGKQEMARSKAIKFVEQHPIMGSEDLRTGETIYKLGIEEFNMDCFPLSKEFLATFDGQWERFNRKNAPGLAQNVEFRDAKSGLYANEARSHQSAGTEFVKP